MQNKLIIALLLLAIAGRPVFAQENTPVSPGLEFKPRTESAPDSKLFPEIQQEARRINKLVLGALLVPTRQSVEDGFPIAAVRSFGVLVRTDAGGKLLAHGYDKLATQLEYFETALATGEKYPSAMSVFTVGPKPTAPMSAVVYYFTGNRENAGELPRSPDDAITVAGSAGQVPSTRIGALESLHLAIDPYQLNANAYTAYQTRVRLVALADEWDDYFEKGRPQTFWDITATTLFEYRHFQTDHLVGPPPRQWFFMHPNVVIENLDAAPDGDQLGGAVAIEWIGVNWWNLKIPFGFSLSSLYSDRPGVDDVGHGVTLYFANKYCIGWASHGGDNGFYVSMDALKLIDSKKSKLEDYRSQLLKKLGK